MLGPIIVQSDHSVLLEVAHPQYNDARHALEIFAELERAPEHIHSYRITRLGLWNARAAGHTVNEIIGELNKYAKFPVPTGVAEEIKATIDRYGKLRIERDSDGVLLLKADDPVVMLEVTKSKKILPLLPNQRDEITYEIEPWARGELKQQLLARGWPAEDLAGFRDGEPLTVELAGDDWSMRDYQKGAVSAFAEGGSGVVVLPCGAGKTIVGVGALTKIGAKTLILVTNSVSAKQWRAEILARTTLTDDEVGEYSGQVKEIKPVTIATYQILTAKRQGEYAHLSLLDAADWGLVIYDEVHLLPAPVFKLTAELQARRRLGLTATLIREDGREGDVFSLIGPKRFSIPWKDLEADGFIATAACTEIRATLPTGERLTYAAAEDRERYTIAATAKIKEDITASLIRQHPDEQILVIGQYLDQLDSMANTLNAPLITGKTPVAEREELFQAFRTGAINVLVVSKVANFSVDLPDASVAIQVSGAFGSRQEEAQRLGRLLRPKSDGRQAHFYSVVAKDTIDQDFALNRQRFLTEQGYAYTIVDAENISDLPAKS